MSFGCGHLTTSVVKELKDLKDAIMRNEANEGELNSPLDPEKHVDAYLHVRVYEQRVTNLLQSLLGHKDAFLISSSFMTTFVAAMVILIFIRSKGISMDNVNAMHGTFLLDKLSYFLRFVGDFRSCFVIWNGNQFVIWNGKK